MKVLVVEDQPAERLLLTQLVRLMGHQCDAVGDGWAALERLSRDTYEVVFLDLVLPGLDGESIVPYVRRKQPHASIVVCSTLDDEGALQNAFALGATAYLVKPFTRDDIRSILARIEQRAHALRRIGDTIAGSSPASVSG